MNRIYISIILFTGLFLVSCQDDFLDINPESEATSGSFYKTTRDFEASLMGSYDVLQSVPDLMFEMVEYRSDNLFLDAPTSGTLDRYNIDQFSEVSSNGIVLEAWKVFYQGIARTNDLISRLDGQTSGAAELNQILAEAQFIRALNYFYLVRFFGQVPLVLKPVLPSESLLEKQVSIDLIYDAIITDLVSASENLPSSYSSDQFGRATQGAARALLGKVYLTRGDYASAEAVLDAVISSNHYELLTDIADVFDVSNNQNVEIIFSVRFNKDIVDEGHIRYFVYSDPTSTPISTSLSGSYDPADQRKGMLDLVTSGAEFIVNKYFDLPGSIADVTGNDFIMIRYADVELMYAEALNGQGYIADGPAFTYLNNIRQRAGLNPLSSADIPDQSSFRGQLLQERWQEFPLEGHRWFDLLRFEKAPQMIADNQSINIQAYQLLFPIPESEIQKIDNPELLKQNQGY